MATALCDAYLAGGARAFFDSHYSDAAGRRRAVRRAARPLAPDVADVLDAQNAGLAPSAARDAHLRALRDGAAAVVTGQQVGLFLGPLYTFYKAASAVCVARALSAESGRAVVPVFWLQTEDHDLVEIAGCNLGCTDGAMTLRLPSSPAHRTSIAHCVLPDGVATCLDTLRAELGRFPYAGDHLARLARHYQPGATWAGAFAGVLAELFADAGLVVVDPRDPGFGAAAAAIHRRALGDAESISAALLARGQALAGEGFTIPVHVRPGAPLSFFHPDGPAGPRFRLEPASGGFAEVGGARVHTRAALLSALEVDPLHFSTSALLRPIFQDALLPTAAYVGGPAEVAYFAQLPPLYATYGLPMPVVVPRARVRILDAATKRLLDRLGLGAQDLVRGEEDLLAAVRAAGAGEGDELAHALLRPFDAALAAVRERIAGAGPGLGAAADKTRATVQSAVARLAGKYRRALLHQDENLVRDLRRAKALLYPRDMPQERFYAVPYFAARYGERAFRDAVLAAIDPFDPGEREVCP